MNTVHLIVGNLCTLLAMGCNALSSTRKTTKGMLLMQSLSQAIYSISGIVLKGYSAVVQNIVSILRNFAAIRNIKSKFIEWTLVVLGLILGIVCNNRGFWGLIPVFGNLQYTLTIFRCKNNERALKISFLISVISFIIFNVVLYNFVGVLADTTVAITTAICLIKDMKK